MLHLCILISLLVVNFTGTTKRTAATPTRITEFATAAPMIVLLFLKASLYPAHFGQHRRKRNDFLVRVGVVVVVSVTIVLESVFGGRFGTTVQLRIGATPVVLWASVVVLCVRRGRSGRENPVAAVAAVCSGSSVCHSSVLQKPSDRVMECDMSVVTLCFCLSVVDTVIVWPPSRVTACGSVWVLASTSILEEDVGVEYVEEGRRE